MKELGDKIIAAHARSSLIMKLVTHLKNLVFGLFAPVILSN